jgi:hypothetical protein
VHAGHDSSVSVCAISSSAISDFGVLEDVEEDGDGSWNFLVTV